MKPIQFPRDSLPHNNAIEWWYFNGHLEDNDGNKYGYMASFFKFNIKKTNVLQFIPKWLQWLVKKPTRLLHGHIVDVKNKKYYPHYQIYPASPLVKESTKTFNIRYGLGQAKETTINEYQLRLIFGKEILNLKMKNIKKPLIEGNKGLIDIGKEGKSYYYTLSKLTTTGSIIVNGKYTRVTGESWMDHQWGDFTLLGESWVWFGIQLDNNIEIMIFSFKGMTRANIIYENEEQKTLTKIKLNPLRKWKSEKTGQEYDTAWHLRIEDKEPISLTISSVVQAQEMKDPLNAPYYEGKCIVKGTIGRKQVKGNAYLEITDINKKWYKR